MTWFASNWVLVLTVAVIAGLTIYQRNRGFLRAVISMCSVVIAVVLTRLAVPIVLEITEADGLAAKVLICIAVYIASRLLIQLIVKISDLITKLPILHSLNHLAGGVLGFIEGLLIVSVFFLIVRLLSESGEAAAITAQIERSEFLSFLYDNNLLAAFIEGWQEA